MLIASLVFFTACHKESDVLSNEQKESSSQEYIEFMGKKVLKPSGVDARVFSQVPGEFMNYSIQKYFGSPGGRTLTDVLSTVTLNKFVDIVEEEDKKFPDLSQYPLRATDLDRIKRDLPFIENEQQVRENTDIVFEYYESLLRNDVANTLSRNIKSSNAGRIASDDYEANPLEKQIGYDNPRLAAATLFGKNEAKKQTDARFVDGSKQNDTKANAFKHAMWNALTIHKCIAYGKSKYGAINDTRTIITAHEYDTDGTGPTGFWNNHFGSYSFSYWFTPGLSHAMDLHNNCLGRNFMQEEVKWGIFGLRSQPGYSEMADRFVQYLNQPSTFQLTNESQILSMYANDWSNLAHLTNAWTYNNAHRDQFAYINN